MTHALQTRASGSKGGLSLQTTVALDGVIRDSCSVLSEAVYTVSEGDVVEAIEYNGCWFVKYRDKFGYISSILLERSEEMMLYESKADSLREEERIRREKEAREQEKKRKEEQIRRQRAEKIEWENERREDLISVYGEEVGQKLFEGYYWIGMTAAMARAGLGEPNRVNSTVIAYGRREQWVYDNMYLYFENGKLTSYQYSK